MKVTCPKCSVRTTIEDDLEDGARVRCDRCGKRFLPDTEPIEDDASDSEGDGNEEHAGGSRSRMIFLAACVGLVLLIAGLAVALLASRPSKPTDPPVVAAPPAAPQPPASMNFNPTPAPKPAGDGEQLTAPELLANYRVDRPAAAARYDGATLTVTGKVRSADQHAGEVAVQLADGPSSDRVLICRFPPAGVTPDRFPAGTVTTVRGRCNGTRAARFPGDVHGGPELVVLTDCAVVTEPLLPTPDGVDYPQSVTTAEIEVRVARVFIGHPVLALGTDGPNAGATARTRDKYLVFHVQVTNKRVAGGYVYPKPDSFDVQLTDERGNRFEMCRYDVAPEPGSVMAQEVAANPKRRLWFRDESPTPFVAPGKTGTYLLIFRSNDLGKGSRLFLSLKDGLTDLARQPTRVIRFHQSAVEPMPLTPTTAPVPADPSLDAKVAGLIEQLAKGKTPAERLAAADDLRKLGVKATAATAPLCQALLDPALPVRLAALGALKAVNPTVCEPVAAIVAPITDADLLFLGSSGRLEAVTTLVNLGAEGRVAVPVLVWFKGQISKPGGWPHVAAVVDALARMAPDDPAVVALLAQGVTKDGYAAARSAAAKGLAATKATKESVAALATAVRGDAEAEVRLAAIDALAKFGAGAKDALKSLEAAKADSDARVREAARAAIDKVK